jgi:hypothetical protein
MNRFLFIVVLVLMSCLFVRMEHNDSVHAQASTPNVTIYVPVASLAECAWPAQYAVGTPALAECRINLNGVPAIALALNGGPFTLVGSSPLAAKFTSLSCSAFGRVGAGTRQTGCTEQ